jgi:hypothetical protein
LFYDLYRVKDTDTPELIAYAMYGSPFYHWVILMANNVIDPYLDWPMPDSIFNEWVEDKYKHLDTTNIQGEISPGADKTKYWITDSGIVVNQTDPLAVFPISHRLYEDLLNNQKRMIKIVKPDMLYDVVKQFETLITR